MTIKSVGVIGLGRMAMPIAILLAQRRHARAGLSPELDGGFRGRWRPCQSLRRRSRRRLRFRRVLPALARGARRSRDRPARPRPQRAAGPDRARARHLFFRREGTPARRACRQRAPFSSTARSAARPAWWRSGNRRSIIAGDAKACETAAEVVKGFSDSCTYFGKFGSAIQVKLIANLLVTLNIAAERRGHGARREDRHRPHPLDQCRRRGRRQFAPIRHSCAMDGRAQILAGPRAGRQPWRIISSRSAPWPRNWVSRPRCSIAPSGFTRRRSRRARAISTSPAWWTWSAACRVAQNRTIETHQAARPLSLRGRARPGTEDASANRMRRRA